jgi:hypothetical protein
MWNPFGPKNGSITLTQYDVINLVGAKEAELMIARGQLQQAAQAIEALKAENANLRQQQEKRALKLVEKPEVAPADANTVPSAVK